MTLGVMVLLGAARKHSRAAPPYARTRPPAPSLTPPKCLRAAGRQADGDPREIEHAAYARGGLQGPALRVQAAALPARSHPQRPGMCAVQ